METIFFPMPLLPQRPDSHTQFSLSQSQTKTEETLANQMWKGQPVDLRLRQEIRQT
jgi:hypothetical protein